MKREDLTGFAVDLGGTKTAAAFISNGIVTRRAQIATDASAGPESQLDQLEILLRDLGHHHGAPLGLAVAGRVGRDGQWFAVNKGTLPAIVGFDLNGGLAARFGAGHAFNDAAAAAVAEARFGIGQDASAFGYITVSTGVGGGLVLDKQLLTTANGLAGHIGFTSSSLGRELCGSGRIGTVESVAAGRAIAAAAQSAGHAGKDARDVFAAADAGAEWADEIIDRSAHAVAILCADLAAIMGLDLIALGGGIGLAPGYIKRVQAHLDTEPALFRPRLAAVALGHDSALFGALALARITGPTIPA